MMVTSVPTVDIFLKQGEVYFGTQETQIRTVLGSCVAITMWHPGLLLGGMCHYMLPSRAQQLGRADGRAPAVLSGKFADEALALMLARVAKSGTRPEDYQVKVFGGGNMFPLVGKASEDNVGQKNVEIASRLLSHYQLKVMAEHVGGVGHRNVIFNIGTGDVWIRHQPSGPSSSDTREVQEICLHV